MKSRLTASSTETMELLHFLLEGVALGSVCVLGVCANCVSTWVLLMAELDLTSTFVHLLVALMSFDSIFLVGLFAMYTMPMISGRWYHKNVYTHVVPYLLPVVQIAHTGKWERKDTLLKFPLKRSSRMIFV